MVKINVCTELNEKNSPSVQCQLVSNIFQLHFTYAPERQGTSGEGPEVSDKPGQKFEDKDLARKL